MELMNNLGLFPDLFKKKKKRNSLIQNWLFLQNSLELRPPHLQMGALVIMTIR